MTQKVAILGIGKMGHALARHLVQQGYEITIWNRSKKDFSDLTSIGARLVDEPKDVWIYSDVAITFLANDDAVFDVYLSSNGLSIGGRSGRTAIDMSTISPVASTKISEATTKNSLGYLRVPVSGNPGVLEAGNLTLIASGPLDLFEKNSPLLHAVGPTVLYVGDDEAARIVKLSVNATLAATSAVLSETLLLCETNGIDRSSYLKVLENSAMGSPFIKYKSAPLIARNYDATFTTAMLGKDLRLTLELGNQSQSPLPATEKVLEIINNTCESGLADVDFMAILPYLQNLAGKPADIQPD